MNGWAWMPHMPTLIVTGGSLGALRLNNAVAGAVEALAAAGIQTLHITGKGKVGHRPRRGAAAPRPLPPGGIC